MPDLEPERVDALRREAHPDGQGYGAYDQERRQEVHAAKGTRRDEVHPPRFATTMQGMRLAAKARVATTASLEGVVNRLRLELAGQATNAGVNLQIRSLRVEVAELSDLERMVRVTCGATNRQDPDLYEDDDGERLEDHDGEGVCIYCGQVVTLLGDRFPHLRHTPGCQWAGDGLLWRQVPAMLTMDEWTRMADRPSRRV